VTRHTVRHTVPFIFGADESFDVGSDTGTRVDDADYQGAFVFTGTSDDGHHSLSRQR
jgi:arylsulfatase